MAGFSTKLIRQSYGLQQAAVDLDRMYREEGEAMPSRTTVAIDEMRAAIRWAGSRARDVIFRLPERPVGAPS